MRVKLFISTVVAVFLAAGATTVQAHLIKFGKPVNRLSLKQQAQYYRVNANHALAFLRPWNDIRHWQIVGRHHADMDIPEPSEVFFHRRLLRNSLAGMKMIQRKLEDLLIPHKQGWLCIHGGEGDWNANTGNSFYGGLQMTLKWMGLIYRADLRSPFQQMLAAETGYRLSGYSHAWMAGQWPNTYPPCAQYF